MQILNIPYVHETLCEGNDREGRGFKYLKEVFNRISDEKIKAGTSYHDYFVAQYVILKKCKSLYKICIIFSGIFLGTQIRTLMKDRAFDALLAPLELSAWSCFREVCDNFLGNKKADNYKQLISDMILAFKNMNVLMSPKIHMLHNHVDFFPENLGEVSDEHGEKFHQEISGMDQRYKGKPLVNMLGEYIWFIKRETFSSIYSRQAKRRKSN